MPVGEAAEALGRPLAARGARDAGERAPPGGVPQPSWRAAHPPGVLEDPQGARASGRRARRLAARAAPQLRDPPARARRRPAGGADDARPYRHLDDPDLHPHPPGAAAQPLRPLSPAGVGQRAGRGIRQATALRGVVVVSERTKTRDSGVARVAAPAAGVERQRAAACDGIGGWRTLPSICSGRGRSGRLSGCSDPGATRRAGGARAGLARSSRRCASASARASFATGSCRGSKRATTAATARRLPSPSEAWRPSGRRDTAWRRPRTACASRVATSPRSATARRPSTSGCG